MATGMDRSTYSKNAMKKTFSPLSHPSFSDRGQFSERITSSSGKIVAEALSPSFLASVEWGEDSGSPPHNAD